MTNKIIASFMITMQMTVCMEPVTDRQIAVYRPVDPQDKTHQAMKTADFFLKITEHASLQSLGRLRSTCRLLHDWIGFNEENHDFNPRQLGLILTKDFNRATEALISCAHARKQDVFESIFYNSTPTEQRIRGESLKLLMPHILDEPNYVHLDDLMAGYAAKQSFILKYRAMMVHRNVVRWQIIGNSKSYDEILEEALTSNNYIVMEILHAAGDIDIKNPWLLWKAIKSGSLDVVKMLIDKGADINAEFKKNKYITKRYTPLVIACKHNAHAMVNLLLEKGANSGLRVDQNGSTALHRACAYGSVECARLLLQNNSDLIEAQNIAGRTPLHVAVEHKQKDAIQLLLREGANVNAQDHFGSTPLHICANNLVTPSLSFIPYLLEHEPDIESITLLLTYGADPTIKNGFQQTPLHLYVCNDKTAALLYNHPLCDISAVDMYGNNALHYAIQQLDSFNTIKGLVDKECNVNAQNHNGETPLHGVTKRNSWQKIFESPLLSFDKDSIKSLHRDEELQIIEFLLSQQANPTICDDRGKVPSDYSDIPVLKEAYKKGLFSWWGQRLAVITIASALGFVGYKVINQ